LTELGQNINLYSINIISLSITFDVFQQARLVSIPLKQVDKYESGRICWLQKYTGGLDQYVWAIDNIQVLPDFPQKSDIDSDKMLQFSMNLRCGNNPEKNQYVYF
jgi:hypothetical protein